MSEPTRRATAVLERITTLMLPAGLCLGFFIEASEALQCARGQILVVGRHVCVSRQTFRQYLQNWRTGKPVVIAAPRRTEAAKPAARAEPAKPTAKVEPAKSAVRAEPPVPPPKPMVRAAVPAPPPKPDARGAAAPKSREPEVSAAIPAPAPLPPGTPAVPQTPPRRPAATKSASPFGELQAH